MRFHVDSDDMPAGASGGGGTSRVEVEPHLDVVIVRVYGDMDAGGVQHLGSCLDSLWAAGLRQVALDLEHARGIGPDVEELVGAWARRAERDRGAFALTRERGLAPPSPPRAADRPARASGPQDRGRAHA
jgi:hypothetical protein